MSLSELVVEEEATRLWRMGMAASQRGKGSTAQLIGAWAWIVVWDIYYVLTGATHVCQRACMRLRVLCCRCFESELVLEREIAAVERRLLASFHAGYMCCVDG